MRKTCLAILLSTAVTSCSRHDTETYIGIEQDYWFLLDENQDNIPYVIDVIKNLPKSTQERLLSQSLYLVRDEDKKLIETRLEALKYAY